jgi:hypothetical protein
MALAFRMNTTPLPEARRSASPGDKKLVTCFNCSKSGHYSTDYLEPRRTTDLKEIKEEEQEEPKPKSENESAQGKTPS